ncbi:MAG: UTP--glucose-1-phosphate uridylyltransferase GalU [Rhizobiales bacterium]|nr:UTP--glucose-1-phosphate uridylyltransferase GalU [Hyphomicrobiales bacterium]MBO6700161.1 UTP--glucose-1-phosphate uridylyltransferase GalU [Hyphomicrobiales bacterium]MBO6737674.1 UTP--glucose-1-phosphate uridylyltransferase GalU [Hyphomicrobiales bacterium]MBO6913269.1 UTP--glucose-1-phosphate uridylyltransferase GalU [Hyphomicrobiales bacterium]MBO6954313.1 UTP--glucose-1-phosphate uridylyltransferase GalU [Hyphomicrobiales bacterium]
MTRRIRKAVFPVAGLGTRFLPATKAMPKEMLTVVDRPVIQYVFEEARDAGIEHFIFVTGRNKSVIEDHFDVQVELRDTLGKRGKFAELETLDNQTPQAGSVSYTRQQEPLGLGHAIWCAREMVGEEPFAVLLPDMIMQAPKGCLSQMMEVYEKTGGNIVSVEECAPEETSKYGIVGKGEDVAGGFEVTAMVEKPVPGEAPSNFYISGRYILQPEVMGILENQAAGAGGEIQLTDAMLALHESSPFFAMPFTGSTYDCGAKSGFLAANVAFALSRPDIAPGFQEALRDIISRRA